MRYFLVAAEQGIAAEVEVVVDVDNGRTAAAGCDWGQHALRSGISVARVPPAHS